MVDQLPPTRLKEELRAAVLERRGELDQRTVYRDSELMCQRLVRHSVFKEADTIAGYSAIRGEIEPRSALGDALEDGKRVYLPRVVDEHHLEFVQIEGFAGLEEGAFGVLEPQGPAAPLGEIDLFLVPGVAFDRSGGRIGFGRGYYDRVLGRRQRAQDAEPPCFVGACYDWQVVDENIAVEAHDVAMHLIATDMEIVEA